MRAMGLPTNGDAAAAVLWRPARRRARTGIRGLSGDNDLLEQEGQRQAPVAAEKQRSATHRCVFPDAGVRSDRMQQLLSGAIPCDDNIDDGDQVNEMAIQCWRRDASAVLCVLSKRKRKDFWQLKLHGRNESTVANPDRNARCTDIAQLRRRRSH